MCPSSILPGCNGSIIFLNDNLTYLYMIFLFYRFESFNSIIRQMNLSTNRQACSRDIGKMYAKHQTLKYVINGGSWGNNHRFVNILQQYLFITSIQYNYIYTKILPLGNVHHLSYNALQKVTSYISSCIKTTFRKNLKRRFISQVLSD